MRVFRAAATALLPLAVLAGGCSADPARRPVAPAATATPTTAAAAPTRRPFVPLVELPVAPPLATWVVKSDRDFQLTLDLNMQTAMIERLNIDYTEVDEQSARALAYRLCTDLRTKGYSGSTAYVTAIYPEAGTGALGVILEAQAYCFDTF